jgi:hypothetical protein
LLGCISDTSFLDDPAGRVVVFAVVVVDVAGPGLDHALPGIAGVCPVPNPQRCGPPGQERVASAAPDPHLLDDPRDLGELTEDAPEFMPPPNVDERVAPDGLEHTQEVTVGLPWRAYIDTG